jgi:membrane-associated phospholipid phosphatase
MVAMGAAVVLARLFPRVWWMWYMIAIGCGVTRVLAGAHYASDVAVAAVFAYILGDVLTRWGLNKRVRS